MPKTVQPYDEQLITKFGKELKELLNGRKLTQKEFAKLMGVEENTVLAWVKGRRQPTYTNLCAILRYLNIDYGESLFQWIIDQPSELERSRKRLNEYYEKVGNQSIQIRELQKKIKELEAKLDNCEKRWNGYFGVKPS